MEERQVYSMSSSLYRGCIITEDWNTRFCGACLRIKTGKVIDYQIQSGDRWLSAPIPESIYCQCGKQPDAPELAHIVTMDEAAFVALMEEVRS